MKAKMSTKMLCFVLCLVMLVTSVPVAAITAHTAHAQEDERAASAAVLKTAITDYEVKMDGTIYENMGAAYTAYCNAMKLYDRYYYGGDNEVTKDNLDDAVTALTSATKTMVDSKWTPGSNITEVMPTNADQAIFYNNILYSAPLSDSPAGSGTSTNSVKVNVYHSPAVVFYDGSENVPGVPVIAKIDGSDNKFIFSIYPSKSATSRRDSTEFTLGYYPYREKSFGNSTKEQLEHWYNGVAKDGKAAPANPNGFWLSMWRYEQHNFNDFVYQWTDLETYEKRLVASNYETGIPGLIEGQYNACNVPLYNGLKVKYTPGVNEYVKTLTPNWYFTASNDGKNNVDDAEGGYISNDAAPVYVINYKALTDAVSRNSQKLDISATSTYAGGQLSEVIKAFDDAINLNISDSKYSNSENKYDYANDTQNVVNQVGKDIEKVVNDLGSKSAKPDPAEYQGLRDAIDYQRAKYENTSETGKTLYENWNELETAYKAAQELMKTNPAANYPADAESKMSNAAKTLYAVILQEKAPRVDTVLLENAIDNAQYVLDNQAFFALDNGKAESISNTVNAAKEAIWHDADNYPLDEYKDADSDEAYDAVENQMVNVTGAIKGVLLNFDAQVDYAENYSLNSVITEGEKYTKGELSNNYANSDDVQIAVNNAEAFKTGAKITSPTKAFHVRDLVEKYKEIVLSVYDSFNSLKPAFTTKITDGQIISDNNGVEDTVTVKAQFTNKAGTTENHEFTYTRENNHVIFRTNSGASECIDLDYVRMTLSQDVKDTGVRNDNGLDSINLNLDSSSYWKTESYSDAGSSVEFNTHIKNAKDNAKGNLTATTNNGAKFTLSDIYALSGGNGTDNGNTMSYTCVGGEGLSDSWLSQSTDKMDNILGITDVYSNGYTARNVILAFGVTTVMRGKLSAYIPASTSYTTSADDLSRNLKETTKPSMTEYKLENKFLGAAFYSDPSKDGGNGNILLEKTPYEQSVTVIDITPLTDLVKLSDEIIANSSDYTKSSVEALATARADADSAFDYWTMDANSVAEKMQSRYDALWTAYDKCKNSHRADFGEQVIDYNDGTESGNKTERISYEEARERLYEAIGSNRVTIESIEKLQERINGSSENKFKYLNMTDEQRANVPASQQVDIAAEMKEFLELAANIGKNEIELVNEDAYNGYLIVFNGIASLNADAYIVDNIKAEAAKEDNQITKTITINNQPIIAYESESEIDAATTAIESAVNSKENHHQYTVSLTDLSGKEYYINSSGNLVEGNINSVADAKKFNYGDEVTVENPVAGESCAWFASITAATTDLKQEKHLMTNGTSYTFNVRGNTELFISSVSGKSDEYAQITFINNPVVKNAIGYAYVKKGTDYNLSEAPVQKRMFYQIDKYYVMEDGVKTETHYDPSATPTFTKDTTLLVTYKPIESEKTGDYQIITYRHDNDNQFASQDVKYNQLTTVDYADPSNDNKVQQLIDKNTGKILSYTNSYTFYACDNLNVKPIVANTIDTYVDTDGDSNFDVSVISKPVLSNQRAQFVGSFAKPSSSSATIVGAGVVLDASSSPATDQLTLGDVDGANNILNLSVPVSSIMKNTNQFAVSIGYAGFSNKNISYVSYVTYETVVDGKKISQTVYSNIVTNAELN